MIHYVYTRISEHTYTCVNVLVHLMDVHKAHIIFRRAALKSPYHAYRTMSLGSSLSGGARRLWTWPTGGRRLIIIVVIIYLVYVVPSIMRSKKFQGRQTGIDWYGLMTL